MNHLDKLVHDWGWWNRAYTRFLLRARSYRLVSMTKVLTEVQTVSELTGPENGAFLRLEPRQSLHNLKPPAIALGEHAEYVVDYYKREFAPREDRPFIAYFPNPILYGRQFSILDPGVIFLKNASPATAAGVRARQNARRGGRRKKSQAPIYWLAPSSIIITPIFSVMCCRG